MFFSHIKLVQVFSDAGRDLSKLILSPTFDGGRYKLMQFYCELIW